MSFTGKQLSGGDAIRLIAAAAAITVGLAAWSLMGSVHAYEGPTQAEASVAAAPQAQQDRDDPEANLPYLFAVYIITWAVFFGYVFYISRRQREMQGEIAALKRALEERDFGAVEHSRESGPAE